MSQLFQYKEGQNYEDNTKQDWQDCQSLARTKILIGKPVKE